jgi:hypothetical protein
MALVKENILLWITSNLPHRNEALFTRYPCQYDLIFLAKKQVQFLVIFGVFRDLYGRTAGGLVSYIVTAPALLPGLLKDTIFKHVYEFSLEGFFAAGHQRSGCPCPDVRYGHPVC